MVTAIVAAVVVAAVAIAVAVTTATTATTATIVIELTVGDLHCRQFVLIDFGEGSQKFRTKKMKAY